ncbi:MAG: 50S ribosomal protein L30 [Actinobacteria bacterium]|nr:50S ribosomal protein L30 [Actinomycetota bacterium]
MTVAKKTPKPAKKVAAKTKSAKPTRKENTGPTVVVKQVRSQIGIMPKTKATLRALGLRKIGDVNTLPDRPEIRGMIARVPHLVEVTQKGA